MKRLFSSLIILVLFFSATSVAQQSHFIYLQTENRQPFYVKLNGNVYSSSSTGYVIIPKLITGDYKIIIGFPKSEWPEQTITYSLKNRDAGFLLKNFNEKGWGLFDLQTFDVLMPGNGDQVKNEIIQNDDAFANMLSEVVNDPTIKQTTVVKEESKTVESVVDSEVNALKPETKASNTAVIDKASEKFTDTGLVVVYVDRQIEKTDTITILLPYYIAAVDTVAVVTIADTAKVSVDTAFVAPVAKITDDTKFLDIELKNPNDSLVASEKKMMQDSLPGVTVISANKNGGVIDEIIQISNPKCKIVAHKADLEKFRKKLNAAKTLDDMLILSRKYFKEKCYTTEQVRALSDLFLSDEDKYQFLDIAYPYVSDNDKFGTLENLLSDQYYIKRFKAMINQ